MNKTNILKLLGLGAVGVALVALPGSSANPQIADGSTTARLEAKLCTLEARAQQVADKLSTRVVALDDLQDVEKLRQAPEADNFELILGDSGSWLGVETQEVTADTVRQLNLPAERGVLVGRIVPDSPAAKAGLKEKDVITEINGQRVEGAGQFRRMIREIPSGRAVELGVVRDGHALSVSATLGKSEARRPTAMLAPAPGAFKFRVPEVEEIPEISEFGDLDAFSVSGSGQPRMGIDAEDLEGDLGNYFGAPEGQAVLVRNVRPDSPAAKAGLKSGDVITGVNGQRVRTIRDLREQMRGMKEDKALKVDVLRNKSQLSLNVVLPAVRKLQLHASTGHATL